MYLNDVGEAAYKYTRSGLSIIPIRPDGTKAPALREWKTYQHRIPSEAEVAAWFNSGNNYGIAVVAGSVSGNLEVLDFDQESLFLPWRELVENECLGVTEQFVVIKTPVGGYHVYFRSSFVERNLKLARQALEVPEASPGARKVEQRWIRIKTLIETRGEGGYVLAPPSPASCHRSNRPYKIVAGELTDIPIITTQQRDILLSAARSFNEYVELDRIHSTGTKLKNQAQLSTRPGDDFNSRATWEPLLTAHGWKLLGMRGEKGLWQRPGKSGFGISATTNFNGSNLLYVFSTNAPPFEPEHAYSPFAIYSLLKFDGDFRSAARSLAGQGYGNGNGSAELPDAVDQQQNDAANTDSELPMIDAGSYDLPRMNNAAWDAITNMNDPPFLFHYGEMPIRIETDEQGGPVPKRLTEDRLRYALARSARWFRLDKDGKRKTALPPMYVVRDMLATPNLPLPALVAITECPTFSADGSLYIEAGYNSGSRTFYAPDPGLHVEPILEISSSADIDRAKHLILDELLGDFPFTSEAERAHTVALLLLPFVRGLIAGPTPLHLIEKPSPGTGASLLVDVINHVVTGRPITAMTEGRDEDEWRKRLTARLRNSAPIVLIDNLRRRLDSASLAAAITSTIWEDRLIGSSETLRLPVRCAWVATGNNPGLSSEISRRTIRIRLDARQDRPWLRNHFRHQNLREWVVEHRGELVWAALVIGQSWLVKGRLLDKKLSPLGMFEAWTNVMGGILEASGINGFLGNLIDFYDTTDFEGAATRGFIAAWWERYKSNAVGVADVWELATGPDSSLDLGDKGERSQKIRLGKLLGELRDRHYQIESALTVRVAAAGHAQRAQLWQLIPVESGECVNVSECFSPVSIQISADSC